MLLLSNRKHFGMVKFESSYFKSTSTEQRQNKTTFFFNFPRPQVYMHDSPPPYPGIVPNSE